MTVKKRLERLLKAELRKSRIPGWQEEERLPVEAVLRLMEKATRTTSRISNRMIKTTSMSRATTAAEKANGSFSCQHSIPLPLGKMTQCLRLITERKRFTAKKN